MSKQTVQDVTNCDDCPFSFKTEAYWWCTHEMSGPTPDSGRRLKRSDTQVAHEPPPGWCPLREVETTVRLSTAWVPGVTE